MTEFDSPLAFALHIAERAALIEAAGSSILERAAQIIEREAKAEIGTYQDAIGPFPAWDELKDSTKADRVQQGYTENDPLLRSGELRDSISHETDGFNAVIGSDSDIAVYQELGTPTIPPRPFLGPAALRKKEEVEQALGDSLVAALLYGNANQWNKLAEYRGKGPEADDN